MTQPITIECNIRFERCGRGSRKTITTDPEPLPVPAGRVPRVARLMALAIRFENLIQSGQIDGYAELARLAHVSRARITQIMNLRLLAPDIQESLLFLPRIESGRDRLLIRDLQAIALVPDWRKQRRMWTQLLTGKSLIDRRHRA